MFTQYACVSSCICFADNTGMQLLQCIHKGHACVHPYDLNINYMKSEQVDGSVVYLIKYTWNIEISYSCRYYETGVLIMEQMAVPYV